MAERNVEVCEQTLLCLFLMNVDHLLRQAQEKCRENSTHQRFLQALASVRKTRPNLTQLKRLCEKRRFAKTGSGQTEASNSDVEQDARKDKM
jgi:hypothetical protein